MTYKKRNDFLPFSPPCVGDEEIKEIADTIRSGWISTGPKTKLFEERFAKLVGAQAALAVNSGTAALHTALATSNVEGGEVITTTMTFCSTANMIEHAGARPVFVDVDADSLNMNIDAVERAITKNTRAILPVHFAGQPVDMDGIQALAQKHNLKIIEDAAHALPAAFKGNKIGSKDSPACFSFYATKNLTTGEGGMVTGSAEFIEKARAFILHGMSREAWNRYGKHGNWYYEINFPGFKYNMTDIHASLGLCQLDKLADFPATPNRHLECIYHSIQQHG